MAAIEELKKEVEKLSEEVSRLASENISLKNENFDRLKKNTALQNEVRSLKEAIKVEIEGRQKAEAYIVKITEKNFEKEVVDKFEKKIEELNNYNESLLYNNESLNGGIHRLKEALEERSLERQRAIDKHVRLEREFADLKKSIINVLIK